MSTRHRVGLSGRERMSRGVRRILPAFGIGKAITGRVEGGEPLVGAIKLGASEARLRAWARCRQSRRRWRT